MDRTNGGRETGVSISKGMVIIVVHFLSTAQSIDIIGQWSIDRGVPEDLTRYSQLYDRLLRLLESIPLIGSD